MILQDLTIAVQWLGPRYGGVVVCIIGYIAWYTWRFQVLIKTPSDKPAVYPYRVPVLGHLVAFVRNSEDLLTAARTYYGDNRVPFSLYIGGKTFYVVSNPADVNAVYKNTETLSFDMFLENVMLEFGSTLSAVRRILHIPGSTTPMEKTRKAKSVSQLAHDYQVQQTSGDDLKKLSQECIMPFLQQNLLLENMPPGTLRSFYEDGSGQGLEGTISLKKWTSEVFIHAGQHAYFGDLLFQIDPSLPQQLIQLDDLSWQAFYKYPRFLRPELNRLSDSICASLKTYFTTPLEQRPSQAWFTQALESEYRRVGLSEDDIAAQMLFLYWGINTNVSKVGYWIMAHCAFAPELMERLRAETAPAFAEDGSVDTDYILRSCPQLEAVWLEALRLSAASTTLRYITGDTWVGGKRLLKGNAVLISARQLHFDGHAFGDDAAEFDAQRFLNRPDLKRSPSYRPFGGGKTLCPGRHLARLMVMNWVALVLHRFDIRLASPQTFPRYDDCKPAIGITSGTDDVLLRLSEREGWRGEGEGEGEGQGGMRNLK